MPERVAEEPVQERLEVPKVKSITPLPSDSYLECEYCTKRAIVHILGKNVCEDHIVTVIKEKLVSLILFSEIEKKETEGEIPILNTIIAFSTLLFKKLHFKTSFFL